jgi:hypothetical protein
MSKGKFAGYFIVLGFVMGAAIGRPVAADSIDDAEAKRRGVPVSQIQVEKELAAAKERIAVMQKLIADLQAKLATAQAQLEAATKPAPVATAKAIVAASIKNGDPESDLIAAGFRRSGSSDGNVLWSMTKSVVVQVRVPPSAGREQITEWEAESANGKVIHISSSISYRSF